MAGELKVLAIGDAIGRPGRQAVKKIVPRYRDSGRADFVICNGENCAAGKGITHDTAHELFDAGVDVITSGNHVWDNRDVYKFISTEARLLRPAIYPRDAAVPGSGMGFYECATTGHTIGVVNVAGRVMMEPFDCPFRAARSAVDNLRQHTAIIFVDLHAEATSEKAAMGWYLDGLVSCVFGTHTHIPTADERLLHKGTAFITDIGMTGSYDSVIGVTIEPVLDRFLTGLPVRHVVAETNVKLSGALITVDPDTGRALAIERILEQVS